MVGVVHDRDAYLCLHSTKQRCAQQAGLHHDTGVQRLAATSELTARRKRTVKFSTAKNAPYHAKARHNSMQAVLTNMAG